MSAPFTCPPLFLLPQVLYQRFSSPAGVFEELKGHLSLASTAMREGDNREQLVETSLFMLGAPRAPGRLAGLGSV